MDEWYAIMGAKARTKGRAGPGTSAPGEGAEAALKDVFKGKRPDDIKKVSVTSTFSDLDPDSGRVLPISKRP